ncbi:alpha/beta fold hydrolase [Ruegeria sp. SCPT10]|uniref:alpha/beta fold hydrolase n=1 Tax=Ruegeria sp. SCP10 TaxID=3141377 RepID=UPI00333DE161
MTVPVVFLHGWAMNGAVFDDLARRLGSDFDCHAPDMPGHGKHSKAVSSLDACAAVAKHWTDRLDRPILVGWSMGAGAAWRYVYQNGTSALRALVTIDMSPRMMPGPNWDLGLLGQSSASIQATADRIIPDWQNMAGGIAHLMFAPDSSPTLSRSEIQALLLSQNPVHLQPMWEELKLMDERDTISRIDIPYLICAGAQSRLYRPEVARWTAAQAKHARIQSFANSGHSPHLEEPDAFCDALRGFVAAERLAMQHQDQEVSQ